MDATIFKKKLLMKSWKSSSKVTMQYLNWFFSLLPWTAQMAQTEEFMFQNMAYRPTVSKTGALFLLYQLFSWSATAYLPYGMTELEEKS